MITTKLGKVCGESAALEDVAILRNGADRLLAASDGKMLAVVAEDVLDDSSVPLHKLPQRVPHGLASGSSKNPNIIKIGAGVNTTLFGPEMVAVSQSMGRFAPVMDTTPFPQAASEVMPEINQEWAVVQIDAERLLDLVKAVNTADAPSGATVVMLAVHKTCPSVAVQGDIGAGVVLVNSMQHVDLGTYHLLRKSMRKMQGVQKAAGPLIYGRPQDVSSVTISTKRPNGEVNAVTLTAKTFDRAAEIAQRMKDGHSTTPTTHPASLAGLGEEQVYDLPLVDLPGMNAAAANRLSDAGITTIREYAARAGKPGGIKSVKGIGEAKAERLEEVVNSVWAKWKRDNTAPA